MERILATHVGSLIRPPELLELLGAKERGEPYDEAKLDAATKAAVDENVRKQAEVGIDVVCDGEMGKASWITYLYERVSGLETRPVPEGAEHRCLRAATVRASPAPTPSSTPSSSTRSARAAVRTSRAGRRKPRCGSAPAR